MSVEPQHLAIRPGRAAPRVPSVPASVTPLEAPTAATESSALPTRTAAGELPLVALTL